MDKFTIKIDLGNAAMQTPDQVALALRAIAEDLAYRGDFDGSEGYIIRDYNGNTVGSWAVS